MSFIQLFNQFTWTRISGAYIARLWQGCCGINSSITILLSSGYKVTRPNLNLHTSASKDAIMNGGTCTMNG